MTTNRKHIGATMIALKDKETFKDIEINELISIFFQTILKEIVNFTKRFPEAEIYINQSEPFLYIEIVYDYLKLTKEEEKYFFGLEYRLNKEIKSILGENAPYIEINFVRNIKPNKELIKIA